MNFRLALISISVVLLSGCRYYFIPNALGERDQAYLLDLTNIKLLYLLPANQAGNAQLQDLALEAFRKENSYRLLSKLPKLDTSASEAVLQQTGILTYQVLSQNYYETGIPPQNNPSSDSSAWPKNQGLFSNAAVKVLYRLTNALNKIVIYEKVEETSFQQFYAKAEIAGRPSGEFELDRLFRLNFARVARELNYNVGPPNLDLEIGQGVDFWAYLPFLGGNRVMMKGIRFTRAGAWNLAITTFLTLVYEPLDGESDDVYLQNRASALYNMGQIYTYLQNWGEAADMFALANQTVKSLHYAQSWADAVRLRENGQLNAYLGHQDIIYFTPEQLKPTPNKGYLFPNQTLLNKNILYPNALPAQ